MMKKTVCTLALASLALTSNAQSENTQTLQMLNETQSKYIPVTQYWKEHDIFQHLDLSLTAGTTGIGIDLSTPIGQYVQLRAGYSIMPRFNVRISFPLMVGGQPAVQYDANGNRVETSFDRMKKLLYSISGYEVEDHADMDAKPTLHNFKFLVDVFPFKNNKHWHFTAGFYWGPSKFAIADNTTEAMTSLLSVGMYNRIYERVQLNYPLFDWEEMGISEEIIDKYHLNVIPTELYDKIRGYGRLGFGVGRFTHDITDEDGNVIYKAGESYNMEPGTDCMVHVKAESNSFKPYLGFGYGGNIVKGKDDWKISFDAGALFWGGTAHLYTHDGIDLTTDVENITGKVGDCVKLFKAFKVYPVLELRITKRLF